LARSSLQIDSGLASTRGTFFATPLGVTIERHPPIKRHIGGLKQPFWIRFQEGASFSGYPDFSDKDG
jgi:hypothetical protein